MHDRDIGLVHFGYRDYDPATGRWTAKDPIGFAGGDTDLYNYVLSDPVNLIDPMGLYFETLSDYTSWQLSLYFASTNPNFWTGAALLYDSAALVIPFLPAFGGYGEGAGSFVSFAENAGSKMCLLSAPKMAKHHIFPNEFRNYFKDKGINIDKYTVSIPQNTYHLKGVHGKGINGLPGGWNSRWAEFIEKNPSATANDIYQFGGKLMDEYGLSGLPIIPYK